MNKSFCLLFALASAFAVQAMSLSDARAQIGACVTDSSKMAAVVKGLSAADQVAFLAEVNEAIANMPGSNEAKAAAYLNANKAALKNAAKGNLATLLAEVFATVSPEALPILSERLAADLFSRTADPTKAYSDEQFVKIAETVMAKVADRMASVENGAARSAFAVVMLAQASNGSPADLVERLIKTLPEGSQDAARKEWIPAALGQGQDQSYEPILAGADAPAAMPVPVVVLRLAGPQLLDAMLGDVVENTPILRGMGEVEFGTSGHSPIEFPVEPASRPLEPQGYQGQW